MFRDDNEKCEFLVMCYMEAAKTKFSVLKKASKFGQNMPIYQIYSKSAGWFVL